MKKHAQDTLRQELLGSGATIAEANELLQVAGKLRTLKAAPMAAIRKPLWLRLLPTAAVAAIVLLIGTSTMAFAQSSLPGSWLYPVKRLSENTAVAVDPGYRATLMMRRADEVRQLIAADASFDTVNATLAQYKVEAAAYKTANYSAFEYCKTNLQQAERSASPSEKQMIAGVLKGLGDID